MNQEAGDCIRHIPDLFSLSSCPRSRWICSLLPFAGKEPESPGNSHSWFEEGLSGSVRPELVSSYARWLCAPVSLVDADELEAYSPPPSPLGPLGASGLGLEPKPGDSSGLGGQGAWSIDGPQSWQVSGGKKVLISSYSLAVRRWIEIKVAARASVL